ncbi:MAG TPA: hypothetical protein VM779_12780 [Thermoanaerobaculia bacterium]|nr:hypothetical protein [Thermoanaerobaculia bacterium]
MTVDPRSLIYPGHEVPEEGTGTTEGLEPRKDDRADRRTGTSDELKELDRVERRKKD